MNNNNFFGGVGNGYQNVDINENNKKNVLAQQQLQKINSNPNNNNIGYNNNN